MANIENLNEEMVLSKAGYDKLVAEYDEAVSVKRAEVAERLKEAISYGDLSENAEYDSAKDEQAELEERIHTLETIIRKAKVVQDDDVKGDVVNIGTKVTVKDTKTKELEVFYIVGATEAEPFEGKITTDSSVGEALAGHKTGDKINVDIPDGVIEYEITKVEKA